MSRLPDEQWKRIDGHCMHGWYEVSSHGRVRHVFKTKPPRMIRPIHKVDPTAGSDYWYVHIMGHERKIARLVWEAFMGQKPEGMAIVHRSGKYDNSIWNLRLMPKCELGNRYGKMAFRPDRPRRSIAKVDRDGNVIEVYASSRIAAAKNHISYQAILDRCNGRIKKESNVWLPDGTTFVWEV